MRNIRLLGALPNTGASKSQNRGDRLASAYPLLSPRMLRPRRRAAGAVFPFNDPTVRYFYFARNGIYALAQLWDLAHEEILFPSYFHGVELESLRAAGVSLRFYPVRWGMRVNVEEVVSRIGPRTRAIYLIHYLGFPGPVEELAQVCRQRGLLLIEDCALALLSRLGDSPLGSWGDAAIFCLYKSLPTPNGGALILRRGDPSALKQVTSPPWSSSLASVASSLDQRFGNHSKNWRQTLREVAHKAGKRTAQSLKMELVRISTDNFNPAHAQLGMSHVCHWVIAAQDFPAIVEKRRRNYLHMLEGLQGVAPPVFDNLPPGVCPLSYPLIADDKPAVVKKLLARGIEAVNMWFPTHPAGPQEPFPETDALRRMVLELPCHQNLTLTDVNHITEVARKVLRESSGIARAAQ
jgi:perosamine synthetase